MLKAATYARISRDDRNTPAIANQRQNLAELAKREGYEIVAAFADDGISGYSGKVRRGFLDLLGGIEKRRFDVILAVAEDRFTRSSAEKIGLQTACAKSGVVWHTLASGKVDPSTAEGGLLATITGAVAEFESAMKAERLQRSVADRLAAQKDLGGPRPFGWEANRMDIREPEAAVIRTAYSMILDGASVKAVARMFDASGIPRVRSSANSSWRPQTVRHILLRERNRGELVVKGQSYGFPFPAIIDAETFDRVAAILNNPDRVPRRGPAPQKWSANGLVRCGVCGSYLSQTGDRGGRRSFRCAGEGDQRFKGQRHPQMRTDLLETALSEAALARIINRVHAEDEIEGMADTEIGVLQTRVAELVRQRDLQQQLAVLPGANVTLAMKEISALGTQIEDLRRDLDAALATDDTAAAVELAKSVIRNLTGDVTVVEGTASIAGPWGAYWLEMPIERRQRLLRGLFSTIELMPVGKGLRLRLDGFDPEDW